MRIAVTYDNGNVFGHFGKTEQFKLYDIDETSKSIVSSEVVGNEGFGHGALAGFLKSKNVKVLICGGIGSGAMMALADEDIDVYGGNEGSADAAVEKFLNNELKEGVSNVCDHHDHDHHDHEHGDGCSCHCGHDHDHDHHHE